MSRLAVEFVELIGTRIAWADWVSRVGPSVCVPCCTFEVLKFRTGGTWSQYEKRQMTAVAAAAGTDAGA